MLAVVDTGPLYAVVEEDADYARCRAVVEHGEYRLVIPTMIIAEAHGCLKFDFGSIACTRLVNGLGHAQIRRKRAQRVGFVPGESFLGRQELDHLARCELCGFVEVRVEYQP